MASSHSSINAQAQNGFAKSAAYDQHRPTYPPASTQHLLEQCRIAQRKGSTVVDLAAGTGKFTEALAAREEQFEVIAVEPHDGMREVLSVKNLPRTQVRDGKADAIPLETASVDAVIAAQAFHWFAHLSTLQEVHRVLKPHGVFGMIWNIEHYNETKGHKAASSWEQKLHDLIWTFDDNEPRFRHEKWRAVFDEQIKKTPLSLIVAADPLFALPLGEHHEEWEVWLTKDKIWERFSTLSQIAMLEGEDRERTKRVFNEALGAPDVETNEKGEFAIHGTTYAVWSSKVPAEGKENLLDVDRPGA